MDRAEWRKLGLLNLGFGSIWLVFSEEKQQKTEFTKYSFEVGPPPPPDMREIGTMWQIGVLMHFFGSKMSDFRRFGTTKIRRDF